MANKRARSKIYQGAKKGSAVTNDNTKTVRAKTQRVRILSSKDAEAVGRPGFKNVGGVPGPVDGKQSVRRLMARDPAVGRTQPAADDITTTNVDLVGEQNPTILSAAGIQPAMGAGKKTIRTPRKSPPVTR